MPNQQPSTTEKLKSNLAKSLRVVLVFLAVFIAMSLFELQSYQRSDQQLTNDMPKISNVGAKNINADNLNQYQGRTLILYNSSCKSCKEIVPKYYGVTNLINTFTFHQQPIYLDINHGGNRAIFSQLSVPTTPKQTKINHISYDKNTGQVNDIVQEQTDIHIPRLFGLLFFINLFWTSLFTLIYVLIGNGIKRSRDRNRSYPQK